jgi:hypothetical protein
MTEALAAYLAGFFDGEGHIAIAKRLARKRHQNNKISQYTRFVLNICVSQITREVLDIFQREFGGVVIHLSGKKSYGRGEYSRWDWKCGTAQAATALERMLPFLIVKKEQAELALKFQASMSRKAVGSKGHGPIMFQYRQSCFDEIRAIRRDVRINHPHQGAN